MQYCKNRIIAARLKKANDPNIAQQCFYNIAKGLVKNLNWNLKSGRCTLAKGFWWKSEIKSWGSQAAKSRAKGGDYWNPTNNCNSF